MKQEIARIEKKYGIKLDSTQQEVLSNLIDFVNGNEHTICIKAKAGTGKSLILSMLYDILDDYNYSVAFITPTNKSKIVISGKGDNSRKALTIHALLNLRPNLDIMDFDASQLSFDFPEWCRSNSGQYDVLLIDECSMINDFLYDTLCKVFPNTRLIFSGDESQLAPIKQASPSKSFNTRTLTLSKIYRQPESKIYKVLEYLRNKPIYHFKEISDENGNIIICNDITKMIDKYSYLFKVAANFKDFNLAKMITYTNKRISALNQIIRKKLYSDDVEYHEGEVLTGYDTCSCGLRRIENSKDYLVKSVIPSVYATPWGQFSTYTLDLLSDDVIERFLILSRNNNQCYLDKLAAGLEDLRQTAVLTKQRKHWKEFYNWYNAFLTPVDLVYDGRIIKRKSLDYGYCISAHKSQSSGFSVVLIDMENIWRCPNKTELRQMQYVACSRTISDLIIYQKDDNKT